MTFAVAINTACGSLTPLNVDPATLLPDTDTDPTADDGDAPLIDYFDVLPAGANAEVNFEASHPAGIDALDKIRLTVKGNTTAYLIPDEMDNGWTLIPPTSAAGSFFVTGLNTSPCGNQSNINFEAELVDENGLTSQPSSDNLSVGGNGTSISESGDDAFNSESVGTLEAGSSVCGDLDDTLPGYAGDQDWIEFFADAGGDMTFQLTWTAANADYDLFIFDHTTFVELDSSQKAAGQQPEEIVFNTSSQTFYYLGVMGWSGDGGDYVITVQ